jgi:O-antigen/teichoic acid export membrane protein
VYTENLYIFKWLLLANGLFVLGMVPHYGLYSKGNDRPIIVGHLVLILLFIALLFLTSDFFGPLAVPLSLVSIFIFILFWKCISFYRLTPSDWR